MSYAIFIGADRAAAAHGWLAGYGDEPSGHWLEVEPRRSHPEGATITVGATPAAAMPGVLSEIPQVAETARQLRVSYSHYLGVPAPLTNGGLNEHGVAVRDVWSPSRPELVAMTPRDQTGPSYSDLARLVLDRARTAREGVELIGQLIADHGYCTYGGNSHLIADGSEAWVVIEFAGGQGLWAAERHGPDAIRVSRPGWIGALPHDGEAGPDWLGAPHLVDFAIEQGWHDPGRDGVLDVNRAFGDGQGRWAGVEWIEQELDRRSRDGIRLEDLFWALRTPRLTGDSAGYGQVVPLCEPGDPDLRVLWHAPIGPLACPFTPFLLGVDEIPPEYGRHRYLGEDESARFLDDAQRDAPVSPVPQRVEATPAAIVAAKRLLYLICEHHETLIDEVAPAFIALERDLSDGLEDLLAGCRALLAEDEADAARRLMTRWCTREAERALELVDRLAAAIDTRTRLTDGIRRTPGWNGPEQLW